MHVDLPGITNEHTNFKAAKCYVRGRVVQDMASVPGKLYIYSRCSNWVKSVSGALKKNETLRSEANELLFTRAHRIGSFLLSLPPQGWPELEITPPNQRQAFWKLQMFGCH